MKFAKLKAFLTGKKVNDVVAEKGDGTVMLSPDQAAAVESISAELEQSQAALATANEALTTANTNLQTVTESREALQTQVNAANESLAAIRTELNIDAEASIVEAIQARGQQPGSLGATVTKGKDEHAAAEDAADTLTSYDAEARDIYAKLHNKKS